MKREAIAFFLVSSCAVYAAPTTITYQGQLKHLGQPYTGQCDMIFAVVRDNNGSFVTLDQIFLDDFADGPAVDVENGLFQADLDLTSSVLNNDNLYLKIRVRCPHSPTDTGAYTELQPMQPFAAVPYARQVQGMFVDDQNRIGIGTKTPGFPLNFPNTLGDKISLWGNTGNHYGLGIQSGLLQIHSDDSNSNIAFGHGSSTSFNEVMRIKNSGGSVGIGTNNPSHRLHLRGTETSLMIEGSGTGAAYLRFNRTGEAAENYIALGGGNRLFFKLGGTDLMFLEPSGELGLGTATPTSKVHVLDSGGVDGFLSQATDATYSRLSLKTLNNEYFLQTEDEAGDWFGIFQAGGTAGWKMVVEKNSGDVGIGTTAPDNTLHVHKASAGAAVGLSTAPLVVENNTHTYVNVLSPDASERGILFGDPAHNASGGIIYNNSSTPDGFQFRTDPNSTKVVIESSGDVGIGTTTPGEKLAVNGNVQVTGEVRRPATGNANMVPLCYGNVNRLGTINSGSGNFTSVWDPGFSRYSIQVTGEDFTANTLNPYTILVTPVFGYRTSLGTYDGNLVVQINDTFGAVQQDFSFLIFKP